MPSSAFGGPLGEMTSVAIRSVAMVGSNSVGLIQHFLRRLIFQTCEAPRSLEVNPRQKRVDGDAVVACTDGFDYSSRVKNLNSVLNVDEKSGERRSATMRRFVQECENIGLTVELRVLF